MRLKNLHEAGMNRRDFLKKAGASSILPSLINAGVAPRMAKQIAGPNPPKLFLSAVSNLGINSPADEFKKIAGAYNTVKFLTGKDSNIVHGIANDNENYEAGTFIDPSKLAEVLSDSRITKTYELSKPDWWDEQAATEPEEDWNWDENELHYEFKIGNKIFKIVSIHGNDDWAQYGGDLKNIDLLKGWWESAGKWDVSPMSDEFYNNLVRNNINLERDDYVKEEILDLIEVQPEFAAEELERYGNLEKYGIDKDFYDEHKRKKSKEKPEDIQVPDDYRMASSMHQPFENKLNRILGLCG